VQTNSLTVRSGYRGEPAEVTRVFEMLSPFFLNFRSTMLEKEKEKSKLQW
jgi:hypothetical protein